jgi:hypothetical protein
MVKEIRKFRLTQAQKDQLKEKIIDLLLEEEAVVFAYLHGSLVCEDHFGDIDIAVFVQDIAKEQMITYELQLENKLESVLKYPIDLKIINYAPAHFRYMVIKKGLRLINRSENLLTGFEMRALKEYFDFEPIRRRYLQEAKINAKA